MLEKKIENKLKWQDEVIDSMTIVGAKGTIAMLETELDTLSERVVFIRRILKKIKVEKPELKIDCCSNETCSDSDVLGEATV